MRVPPWVEDAARSIGVVAVSFAAWFAFWWLALTAFEIVDRRAAVRDASEHGRICAQCLEWGHQRMADALADAGCSVREVRP